MIELERVQRNRYRRMDNSQNLLGPLFFRSKQAYVIAITEGDFGMGDTA